MRKLTAILFSDIVGFSKHMGVNESKTLEIIKLNNQLHDRIIIQFGGEVIKAMGDGYLCTFQSSLDAILAGTELTRSVKKLNKFELRVGIHVGDVIHNLSAFSLEHDVFGDSVNIAARIESNAPSAGVWVSERVAADLDNHEYIEFVSAGLFELKNIAKPMQIFEAKIDEQQEIQASTVDSLNILLHQTRHFKRRLIFLSIFLLVLMISFFGWQNWQDHLAPDSIAVMPFEYIGAEGKYHYISEAFSRDLSSQLSGAQRFKILSNMSAKKMSNSTSMLHDLEVDYIIEGSLHYQKDAFKLHIKLVNSDNDETLWSDIYIGTEQDLSSFVEQASEQVLEALRKN